MDFAAALAAIRALVELRGYVVRQIDLARQAGTLTAEQVAQIKTEAGLADAAWDDAVAAAKRRLGGG